MSATSTPAGMIVGDALYNLDAIREFGFGTAALREARRKGLKVRRVGRRGFVLGEDLISFVKSSTDQDQQHG